MLCLTFGLLFFVLLVNAEFDKDQLLKKLENGLIYLEIVKPLDINATFNIVVASGELIYLKETAESITTQEKQKIDNIEARFDDFIDHSKSTQPNEYPVTNLFYPALWISNGDFRFKTGRVSGPASTKSSTEIYGFSVVADDDCDAQLYANTKTDELERHCQISTDCMNKMTNTKEKGSVAPTQRMIFLSALRYLKCAENPDNYFEIVTQLCNLIYKQVLKLNADGYVQNKAYYFMDKVILCGTYGFPEFYSDSILTTLTKQQNDDGSIGTMDIGVKKVLTAQYVAILSSAYRLKFVGTVPE